MCCKHFLWDCITQYSFSLFSLSTFSLLRHSLSIFIIAISSRKLLSRREHIKFSVSFLFKQFLICKIKQCCPVLGIHPVTSFTEMNSQVFFCIKELVNRFGSQVCLYGGIGSSVGIGQRITHDKKPWCCKCQQPVLVAGKFRGLVSKLFKERTEPVGVLVNYLCYPVPGLHPSLYRRNAVPFHRQPVQKGRSAHRGHLQEALPDHYAIRL